MALQLQQLSHHLHALRLEADQPEIEAWLLPHGMYLFFVLLFALQAQMPDVLIAL